jgi:GT2 family glycosyltransferase
VYISIVIPLYNQLAYTKICLESLLPTISAETEIIMVDNASSDGTAEYLTLLDGISVICNKENLGFAGACNQGIKAASGEWVVVMNNDVILSAGWLDGMLAAAKRWDLQMVSPAIREGENNYDIEQYSHELTGRMSSVVRRGQANGICFMTQRTVFETIGFFDENFRIGQYEDKDLFLRARLAGFKLGTVGGSFIHHFGSVTQNSIKFEKVIKPYALENKAYYIGKWKLPWWKRVLQRENVRVVNRLHSLKERLLYGHSLMEKWIGGRLYYE